MKTIFYRSGPKPFVNKDYFRLYGHMLCPFVERAALTLSAKKIQFQKCEMDLQEKAYWHKDLNGGLVPLLEVPNGDIINESAIITNFANEYGKDQGLKLWPCEN